MSRELGESVSQPKVSRWVKEARAYIEAGHPIPDEFRDLKDAQRRPKEHVTPPDRLALGPRTERGRRRSNLE